MPELADIFRDWHEKLNGTLSDEQQHAARDIIACRTPGMERGTVYSCPNCGTKHFTWQSCGNRNCPKCGNDKITKWLAKRQEELLPVDYYMTTFTLPNELHAVCKSYPREVYGAFFKTSSEAFKELTMDKRFLGAKIGMTGTLQTWQRNGDCHPHIHYLGPGGGLSKDGQYWVYPKKRDFLVATKPLAALFKGKFKAEMTALGLLGKISKQAWEKSWIVDCKNVGNGMSSFKYIGTYMQRVFISNSRIEKYDGENVTFRYKESKSGNTLRRTLSALEFMMMFLQHVLPSGFQKTRYYGLLGNANKKTLQELRLAICISRNQPPPQAETFITKPVRCKKCGAEMVLTEIKARAPPIGAIVLS
jgi:predicted Zn-ribbon and HTH transcriptional regulator